MESRLIAQFLVMRRGHAAGSHSVACDTCLAIAAFDEVMRALESLTPGGSDFYQDPARRVDHVRRTKEALRTALVSRAKGAEAAA